MPDLHGLTIAVVGSGALGLTVGLRCAQAGARTTVYGAESALDSASGVAAGMLAPAFEAALDPISAGHFALMRGARDAWPELISDLGLPATALDRSGALHAGAEGEGSLLADLQARLQGMGASVEHLETAALRALRPELSQRLVGAVFTPEDWRIDPRTILAALDLSLSRSGGRRVRACMSLDPGGRFVVHGRVVAADAVVVATGAAALGWRRQIPELAALHPIKGQILTFDAEPRSGPVVRGTRGYVAPQPGGAMAGATMEIGRADRTTDAAAVDRLRAGALDLFPHLQVATAVARAGIRAATADGLPLVGASRCAGVHLAVGARRNGWLLAPLIARVILDQLAGRASPYAAVLRASRMIA